MSLGQSTTICITSEEYNSIKDFEKKHAEEKEKNDSLQKQLFQIKTENALLTNKLYDSKQKQQALQKELDKEKGDNQKLIDKHLNVVDRYKDLQKKTKSQLSALEEGEEKYKMHIDKLKSEVSQLIKIKESKNARIDELEKQVATLVSDINRSTDQTLKKTVANREQVDPVKFDKIKSLEEELAKERQNREKLDTELNSTGIKAWKASKAEEKVRKENAQLKNRIAILEQEKQTSQAEFARKIQQLMANGERPKFRKIQEKLFQPEKEKDLVAVQATPPAQNVLLLSD